MKKPRLPKARDAPATVSCAGKIAAVRARARSGELFFTGGLWAKFDPLFHLGLNSETGRRGEKRGVSQHCPKGGMVQGKIDFSQVDWGFRPNRKPGLDPD